MKIVEYRIIFPIDYNQYDHAEKYMVAKRTREESTGNEGIEVLAHEDYEDEDEKGIFAHKVMHYKSRIPSWIRWAIPENVTSFNEKSWSAFPHGKCVYSDQGLHKFKMVIDSYSQPYSRDSEIENNPCKLPEEMLKKRTIKYVDIISSKPKPDRKEWDLSGFECESANISKLAEPTRIFDPAVPPEWTETYEGPMMVCCKVIIADFPYWGLETKVERYLTKKLVPGLLLDSARSLVAWAPEWSNMSPEEVSQYVMETFEEINNQIADNQGREPNKISTSTGTSQEQQESQSSVSVNQN